MKIEHESAVHCLITVETWIFSKAVFLCSFFKNKGEKNEEANVFGTNLIDQYERD